MPNEVSQQIAREFEQAIIKVLESHGILSEGTFQSHKNDSQRINLGVEIDNACRLQQFVISVRVTNKEALDWN